MTALCGIATSQARADISAFNDFGPLNSYNTTSAVTESGAGSLVGPDQTDNSFVAGASGELTSIYAAVQTITGGSNDATFQLYANGSNGTQPGALLESFTLGPLPQEGSSAAPVQLVSSGDVNLTAGNTYWVGVTAPTGAWVAFNLNSTGALGSMFSTKYGSSGYGATDAAFAVNVQAVPEASTVLTFGMLLAGGGLLFMRRRSTGSSI